MKTWLKIFSFIVIITVLIFVIGLTQEQKNCCLCNSFPYGAPCLIDLETGNMVELALYSPHEANTFSFISLGNVTGAKETDCKTIKMEIPFSEKTTNPALCRNCKKQHNATVFNRYVLADLSDSTNRKLISVESDLSIALGYYKITAQKMESDIVLVIVQGTL